MAEPAPRLAAARATNATSRLVLASASPRRAELLARLGVTPLVRPADVDETPHAGESAEDMVSRLAAAKAHASALAGDGDEFVLAADTIVVLEGRMLGKPRDRDEARQMLAALSGQTHQVITGVAVHHDAQRYIDRVTTVLTFRDLTDADIEWYVGTGECDDKAGAYGLQGAGAVLVERVDGSDTNVIGLPLAQTVALLRRAGLDLLRDDPSPGTG